MRAAAIVLLAALALACGPQEAEVPDAPAGPAEIHVVYRSGDVPIMPDDAAWQEVPRSEIMLLRQSMIPPHGGGSVQRVSLQGTHNGQWLALRLEWRDDTVDREVGLDRFRDAAAIGFPMREMDPLPSPFMGDERNPLDIWQWTADFDANARGRGEFDASYPHTEGVWYFAHDYDVQRRVRSWRGTEPVINYAAHGFGSLTRKSAQSVRGLSLYSDGMWQVVLRRQLGTGNPEDVHFRAGDTAHAVVAVWNGENRDVNGKKSVTFNWTPFSIETTDVASR
jgi:hypothetical protein